MTMDRLQIQIITLLLVTICLSCQKRDFVGEENDPVFTADVSFAGGERVDVVAGDDQYYMYASHIESSQEKVLVGRFGKDETCTSQCLESLTIKIHQKNGEEDPIEIGNYDYYNVPRNGYKHDYSILTDDPDVLINTSWRVGDQVSLGESITVEEENDAQPTDGVRMIYELPGQFIVQFDRSIISTVLDCQMELDIQRSPDGSYTLEVITGSPFAHVKWSTGAIGTKITLDPQKLIYTASVIGGGGCKTDFIIKFHSWDDLVSNRIGMSETSYVFTTPQNPNNAIEVSYTAPNGVRYTSTDVSQILPYEFNIIAVEDYLTNENGEPTIKITADFDCILFGSQGKGWRIDEGRVVFAVSY